jgi:16S rRNA (cytosine967-C5)-methyltransferase
MTVLDACAAPGGKTGHILESANNLDVIAVDNSETRLKRVTQNLERLQLKANVVTADALDTEKYAKDKQFDRILLDAPCSATGVIRRHPDIKVLRRESDIAELSQLQGKMLDALWEKLKPEGIMLYATCSVLPEENEQQIEAFIKRHDDNAEAMPIKKAQGLGRQVFTGDGSLDGFYFCLLRKASQA